MALEKEVGTLEPIGILTETSVTNMGGEVLAVVNLAPHDTGADVIRHLAKKLGSDESRLWRLDCDGVEFEDALTARELGMPVGGTWTLNLVVSTAALVDRVISTAMTDSVLGFAQVKKTFSQEGLCDYNCLSQLCIAAKKVLMDDPILLELHAPITICGDMLGDYTMLLQLFELVGSPAERPFLFLGNYVDKATLGIQTFSLLLAYKVRYPDRIYLLRGNHEHGPMTRLYGFYGECKRC